MVLIRKWPLFELFFLGNKEYENVFNDILERKIALLRYKNKHFKSRKLDIFPKALTHCFNPKMAIFHIFFFLSNISQEYVFYDFLERKKAFQGYKNKNFKSRKIDIFSKPMVLVQKGPFSNFFFFGNIGQEMSFAIF